MPPLARKRRSGPSWRGRGGYSTSKIASLRSSPVKMPSSEAATTSQIKSITSAVLRGRTRAATKAPSGPLRTRKQAIICSHTIKALQENAHEIYKEVLELFVIPSSKCLIPWDPRQSRLLFSCQVSGCKSLFEFVCCHCQNKFCREHEKEHALELNHGCAINTEMGYAACFCCGELLVHIDKYSKLWRDHRLSSVYETSLRHGWLTDVQLDCFLPNELREACVQRNALVGVHGIVNLSNTCCLSVILQTFGHTPLFRDYCLARLHRCDPNVLRFDQNCVMCAFTSVIFDLYVLPAGQCYAPQMVFQAVQSSLCKHGSELGEQEDPAEILNLLLTDMHLRTEKDGRKISPALSQKLHLYERETATLCVDHAVYCPCVICDLFSGVEEFTTTCLECKQDRVQGNSFKLLMLPIREDKPNDPESPSDKSGDLSLEDCLKMYTVAHFTSECKNDCCVDVRGAFRTNRFRHLPVVLIIQLKRAVAKIAKAKPRDGDFKKNRDHIQFPLTLDMAPYMAPGHTGSTRYVLYAVIVHKGTKLSSGHYVCYFKHMNGRWLSMDDRAIFCFSEAHVLALQAYMLFYIHETVEFTVDNIIPSQNGHTPSDNTVMMMDGSLLETTGLSSSHSPTRSHHSGSLSPRQRPLVPDPTFLNAVNDHTYSQTTAASGGHLANIVETSTL